MPAQSPTNGNATGGSSNATSPSSALSNPQSTSQGPPRFNKIPVLTSKSRSFFLFLAAGAVIIGVIVVFFLVGKKYVQVAYPEKGLDPNSPAVIVDGEIITVAQYQAELQSNKDFYENVYLKQEGATLPDGYIEKLDEITLRRLIDDKILDLYTSENGLEVTQEEIREELEESVVNPNYDGDWQAYENELLNKHGNTLENVYKNTKRDLQIRKIKEKENLEPYKFDEWFEGIKGNYEVENKSGF